MRKQWLAEDEKKNKIKSRVIFEAQEMHQQMLLL